MTSTRAEGGAGNKARGVKGKAAAFTPHNTRLGNAWRYSFLPCPAACAYACKLRNNRPRKRAGTPTGPDRERRNTPSPLMAGRERQQRVMGGQAAKGGKQRASARRNRTEGTAAGAPKSAKEVRSGGQDWPGLPWMRRGPCEGGETTRLRFVTDDSPQRRPRSGLALQKNLALALISLALSSFPARVVYPSSIACCWCWEWDRF